MNQIDNTSTSASHSDKTIYEEKNMSHSMSRSSHISAGEFDKRVRKVWECAGSPYLLLCVSGGADSVALLRSMVAAVGNFVDKGDIMTVLHCDFHLRGEESERDRVFVEMLCKEIGVPVKVRHFDVEAYRKENPCSIETACRELRYGWFREEADAIRRSGLCVRIVTGHNADDNIETLLLNLFRGAGIKGLKGMLPDTGEILRPLLSISRSEILNYLGEDTPYITDSSNLTSDYRRNFIRNEVLPLVESRWPGVRKAIGRTLTALRDEESLLSTIMTENEISIELLRNQHGALTLVHRLIYPHGGNMEQAKEIVTSARATPYQSGKIWPLKDGSRATLERESLQILPAHPEAEGATPVFCWGKVKLTPEEFSRMRADRSHKQVWLPYGPERYELRRVSQGDRIKPLGMKGSRLLSDIMKDAHKDRKERESQWVLTDRESGEIIWAPGLRRSRLHLINEKDEWAYIVTMCS